MTVTPEQSTAKGWTPDDSTFGARLALIRQRMGWGNVREAAVECGLPPESWRTWERDNVTPRRIVEIAGLIANRTGCDYGWLLAGDRLRSQGISPNGGSAHMVRPVSPAAGYGPFGQKPRGSSRPGSPGRRPALIGPGRRAM